MESQNEVVSHATAPEQRRKVMRVDAIFAVELSSKAKPGRCGVTRNASGSGLLIVTPSRFDVGDEVDVAVHVGTQLSRASARVVRVEENRRDSPEVWRYRLAIELHGALSQPLVHDARSQATQMAAG